MFPYLEKYLVTDYLPKLVDRIEYMMNQLEQVEKSCKINDANSSVSEHSNSNVCNRALLLDYKAEGLQDRSQEASESHKHYGINSS